MTNTREVDMEITFDELYQAIQSSFDGIVISDADGRQLLWNKAIEKITGLNNQDYDTIMSDALVNTGVIDQSVTLKVLEEKKPISLIQRINTGKKVLVSGVPIKDEHGNIKKIVCNVRDLTELNLLEKEILELTKQNKLVNDELEELKRKQNTNNLIIAHDPKTKEVVERAKRVALFNSVVLIQGESGVGKEGLVNFIHQNSNRKNQSLVKVNCGAIPEELLESELFGYESGSFTGANQKGKKGLFQMASEGTIFLDEISELPLRLQVKLLRVLQEYEIIRIGGTSPIKVDVRVITATNRNLSEMVKKGEFREDLFYRLNIIPIHVYPLRERLLDIVPLINHFLNKMKMVYGFNRAFSEDAIHAMNTYEWPGNVRELQNLVERLCLMVNKSIIHLSDIKEEVNKGSYAHSILHGTESFSMTDKEIRPLKQQVEEFEEILIRKATEHYPSIRQAAKALKIDQSTLVRKIQKYKCKNSDAKTQW